MNFSVILAYAVLLFEMIFIIAQGGKNMTSEIIAAIIAGIFAVVVAVIGNVITFLKARHNEKNEHDNLEKEHEDLSKGQNSIRQLLPTVSGAYIAEPTNGSACKLIQIQQARLSSRRKTGGGPPVRGRLSW